MNKVREIKNIFAPLTGFNFLTLSDLDPAFDVVENGKTFLANADLKAKGVAKRFSLPALAEDSGLVVPVLNGEPGVRSARYDMLDDLRDDIKYTRDAQDARNRKKLIKKLQQLDLNQAPAHFIAVMVYRDLEKNIYLTSEGRVDGFVITQERGEAGFGYDPVFIPRLRVDTEVDTELDEAGKEKDKQKTFAELGLEKKNQVSHRKKALLSMLEKMKEI